MLVRCPKCKKESEYNATNPYRPFCSERCKTNDLGDWASGKYFVPTEEPLTTEDDENPSDDPQNEG